MNRLSEKTAAAGQKEKGPKNLENYIARKKYRLKKRYESNRGARATRK